MAIAHDVATNLGRPLTGSESDQVAMWARWIDADIDRQATMSGLAPSMIDFEARERFTVAAISHRIQNPRRATRVSVGVDDGRVALDVPDAAMEYLPHWWAWLGLPAPDAGMSGWSGSIPYSR